VPQPIKTFKQGIPQHHGWPWIMDGDGDDDDDDG